MNEDVYKQFEKRSVRVRSDRVVINVEGEQNPLDMEIEIRSGVKIAEAGH